MKSQAYQAKAIVVQTWKRADIVAVCAFSALTMVARLTLRTISPSSSFWISAPLNIVGSIVVVTTELVVVLMVVPFVVVLVSSAVVFSAVVVSAMTKRRAKC